MGSGVITLRLRHVHQFTDRHGRVRTYFRKPGCKAVVLPGLPGSPEFSAAYAAAVAGHSPPREIGASRTTPGTISAAIVGYYSTIAFRSLAPKSQATYRGTLEGFRARHGDKRIAMMARRHINTALAEKAATPAAANQLLKRLRSVMAFALAEGMITSDPTAGVRPLKNKSEGFAVWSETQIAQYRAHHALGTRARLALELLLGTGQRRSDVVRMGKQHVRSGTLSMRQQKTKTLIEIPVLPDLAAALAVLPAGSLTFLTTEYGKAFTANGFGGWFRDRCNEAGVPVGYSAHGLRKAAATRHADRGATAHELMSWFGWSTIKEAERYTRTADRRRLSAGMAAKLDDSN